MIRILVVEDQQEKKRSIIEELVAVVGISIEHISSCDNVLDGKRLLQSTHFHLLVLDLNIPKRGDQLPSKGAGLDLVDFIREGRSTVAPSCILGLTAYDEEFGHASDEFSPALWKLLRYDADDAAWRSSLRATVEFLVSQHLPPFATDGTTFHTDVGVVVALEEELAPFQQLLDRWEHVVVRHDSTSYHRGYIRLEDRSIEVTIALCPRMGMPAAAVAATKLIEAFRPRYLLTSGICAGVRGKVAMGDLLVADPCYDWGSGKVVEGDSKGEAFKPASYQWRLAERLRARIAELGRDAAMLNAIYRSFGNGPRPPSPPVLHIEAMASGGSVLGDARAMADIMRHHKNLIGIDMENYAVISAAEYANAPAPMACAVKSVCDFGDGEKDDQYHAYSAHVSAAFICEVVRRLDW